MQIVRRYYLENGQAYQEVAQWLEAGTGANILSDPRNRFLPGLVGLYFFLAVTSPAADLVSISREFAGSIPFDHEYWSLYNLPLREGVKLLTKEEYETLTANDPKQAPPPGANRLAAFSATL